MSMTLFFLLTDENAVADADVPQIEAGVDHSLALIRRALPAAYSPIKKPNTEKRRRQRQHDRIRHQSDATTQRSDRRPTRRLVELPRNVFTRYQNFLRVRPVNAPNRPRPAAKVINSTRPVEHLLNQQPRLPHYSTLLLNTEMLLAAVCSDIRLVSRVADDSDRKSMRHFAITRSRL
ncbi:hypothetical protein [Hyphomicrobium sp.]|uniref:hypothetical protein n=1 Tax=Hyphomicrobium sp. TaxID=82 RepID=UPI003569494A